jgi:hypothetical protein
MAAASSLSAWTLAVTAALWLAFAEAASLAAFASFKSDAAVCPGKYVSQPEPLRSGEPLRLQPVPTLVIFPLAGGASSASTAA